MSRFSNGSLTKLKTCDAQLQDLFLGVVGDFDCTVLCGSRGEDEQTEAFDSGNSKVKWPNSKHNSDPSRAVDVAPYPIVWDDIERFYYFAGYVMARAKDKGISLRWGGDWDMDTEVRDNNFNDLVHFELLNQP